jgi:predicted nuclease of predicted toxin-antitoxin system
VREGPPPKVVWVRLGNCTVDEVAELLRSRRQDLERFDAAVEAFLVIGTPP